MESEALRDERSMLLAQMGVPPIDRVLHPDAFVEIRRIAFRLRHSGSRAIGFVPADDHAGAIALAIQVALAMDQFYGATCNVLDANTARPQFSSLPSAASVLADPLGFRTLWIAEHATLSTPAAVANRPILAKMAQALQQAICRYDFVFADLTGLVHWGEHCSAYGLVDGVVVVARANRTLEEDILICVDDIPPRQRLGVVLVG